MTTRRRFLQLAVAGTAATCASGLAGCPAAALSGTHAAGNLADLPEGGTLLVATAPLVVLRDALGLWALTTICPHLDCDMAEQGSIAPDELVCDCHGSRFDGAGAVLEGPATQALAAYAVLLDADSGAITVDADQEVDGTARTPVAG